MAGTDILARPNGSVEVVDENGEVFNLANQPTALEAITRAEIDVQVATAKRFPRSISRFIAEAKSMVNLDPDLAAQCTYVLPSRKPSDPPISGPSVRLAEICALCWGNLRVVGRITDDDGKFLTAQAVAMDLERNVGYAVEVRRGITYGKGSRTPGARYSDDMIKTTGNAAISIATRNATFKVIPRAFVNLIQDEADRVARGDVKSLPERTDRAVAWFVGKGVKEERIYAALGVAGRDDVTLDLLARLNGFKTAVNDGHATFADLFPEPAAAVESNPSATPPASSAEKLLDRVGGRKEPKASPKEPEPEPGSNG